MGSFITFAGKFVQSTEDNQDKSGNSGTLKLRKQISAGPRFDNFNLNVVFDNLTIVIFRLANPGATREQIEELLLFLGFRSKLVKSIANVWSSVVAIQ